MYTFHNRADSVTINPGTREVAWIYCHIFVMIAGALAIYEGCYGAMFRSLVIKCLACHVSVFCCLFQRFRWQNFTTGSWNASEFSLQCHQKARAITIPSQMSWPQPKVAVRTHPTPTPPHSFYYPILLLNNENETVDVFPREGRNATLNSLLAWLWLCLKWPPNLCWAVWLTSSAPSSPA